MTIVGMMDGLTSSMLIWPLVLAVMISRLDYCNSVLAGVPLAMLGPLQRVQNAAVRLIFELTLRDHYHSKSPAASLATSTLVHRV